MAAQSPRHKMPPLTALRAFEAAGRLGGFAPAALELGVTPGAVTAHLKTLESAIGAPLFERKQRSVELTELGIRALPGFTQAFRDLESALQQLQAEASPDLVRIATTSDLAQLWLSPRLRDLRTAGRRIELVICETPEEARARAEIGIFPDETAGPVSLILVGAPELAARISAPSDLTPEMCLILLGPMGDWSRWNAAAGLTGFEPAGAVHMAASLALSEVAYGAGSLVIAEPYAREMIRQGRLTQLAPVRALAEVGLQIAPMRPLDEDSAAKDVLSLLQAGSETAQ